MAIVFAADFATGRVGVLVWTVGLESAVRESILLNGCPPAELGRMIIAVKELAGILLAVAAFGGAHQGALIIQPCDNQNTVQWLEHRRADNEYAQAMLGVIGRLEVAFKVQLYVPYIHTERNKWNDLLTRPEIDGVAMEAELPASPDVCVCVLCVCKFDRDDLVVSHPHFNCREDTEVLFRQVTQHFDVQFHDDIVAAVH